MAKKLTYKEAKLVKGIAEGKTQREAYMEAYDTKGNIPTVDAEASKTISKPHVKEALYEALSARGITPDKIIAPVAEALEHDDLEMRLKGHDRAVKLVGVDKGSGGTTIIFNQGDVVKSKYVKD